MKEWLRNRRKSEMDHYMELKEKQEPFIQQRTPLPSGNSIYPYYHA